MPEIIRQYIFKPLNLIAFMRASSEVPNLAFHAVAVNTQHISYVSRVVVVV